MQTDIAQGEGWYVVYCKPQQEVLALENLLRQGFAAWLPRHTRWQRRAGQWTKTQTPMFPRYLFLRPASAQQSIGPVRSTLGVSTLVRFGPNPAIVPEPLVQALRRLEAGLSQNPAANDSPFAVGQWVSITQGPFRGIEGVVAAVARERVAVLLSLLGREQPLQFLPDALIPAAAA